MIGFAALAEVALAEVPGVVTIPPPIPTVLSRTNNGMITTLDAVAGLTYGAVPQLRQPFVLIVNLGFQILPSQTISLVLTGPSGQIRTADNNFLYIGPQVLQLNQQVSAQQYLVYPVEPSDDLNEAGIWSASATVGSKIYGPFRFQITKIAPAPILQL